MLCFNTPENIRQLEVSCFPGNIKGPPRKLNITVPNIKLNNFILTPEKTATYLGTEIDENLSWREQIFSQKNLIVQTVFCRR